MRGVPSGVALALAALLAGGCVQVEVNPREIVTDTIDAGRELYRSVRRRVDGVEERRFTHRVPLGEGGDTAAAGAACLEHLRALARRSTDEEELEVLEESTELIEADGAAPRVGCALEIAVREG